MPFKSSGADIFKSIEAMDREGMRIVEAQDPVAFTAYLRSTANTICGRHPIGVYLNALRSCKARHDVGFVRYEQSSQVRSAQDSSVSYASAVVRLKTA